VVISRSSNFPSRIRYRHLHPTTVTMPTLPECFEASRGPCERSSLMPFQDPVDCSIHICEDRRSPAQQPGKDRPMVGDFGKLLPSCDDKAMALNPSRWHMVLDKDHSPCRSPALNRPTKSTKINTHQKTRSLHDRWSSDVGANEETVTWSTAERKRSSKSQRVSQQSTGKALAYRARHTAKTSSTTTIICSVPSVIVVPTYPPNFQMSSLVVTGPERPIRRRSFVDTDSMKSGDCTSDVENIPVFDSSGTV
jgi:hypothetical protein